MELKEFVAETINQIIDGIIQAQVHAAEVGARVNPDRKLVMKDNASLTLDSLQNYMQLVEFDVAVTATEESGAKVGLGIFVTAITAGAQTKLDYANSVVNRIRFTIPVELPKQK